MTIEKVTLNALKKDCSGCRTCATDYEADNLKHALLRLNGVSKVNVDKVTGKITITYDKQKILQTKITERVEKLGYKIELISGVEIQ